MKPNEISVCKVKLWHETAQTVDIGARVPEICEPLKNTVKPGSRIAIAVGSRGVANIAAIAKAAADFLKSLGALPFIVPAMGSHGGATAEGQRELLAGYGITEEKIGVPVLSSMETEYLGDAGGEDAPGKAVFPVYFDKNAFGADGTLVINRVKAHTDFHGYNESGIVKMLVIGLGKHRQAALMHRFGADGLRDLIPVAAKKVLDSGKIIGGIAVLEDGLDRTADLVFAKPRDFIETDHALLLRSKSLMAKLPFKRIDALVIDKMGKDISGTGMDTNVIGRMRIKGQEDAPPDCKKIAVLDITDGAHGNATGMGLADVTTKRMAQKIDWDATNANIITSGFLERGFLPIVAETDEIAVTVAVGGGYYDDETIRFARITDTLHLDEAYVSKALLLELLEAGKGEQVGEFKTLSFLNGAIEAF